MFPGDEFVAKYETSEPLENAIGVGVVFAICAAAFIVYDYLVERRKNTLMTAATKTGLPVNSLFPELHLMAIIREHLFIIEFMTVLAPLSME